MFSKARVVFAVRDYDMFASRVRSIGFSVLRHLRLTLAMTVDVFPSMGISVGELIWSNPNDIAIYLVQLACAVRLSALDEIPQVWKSSNGTNFRAWVYSQGMKVYSVDCKSKKIAERLILGQ